MSFAVSGLASGIDSSALIEGLMIAERSTVRRLENTKALEEAELNAWNDLEDSFGALSSSLESIRTGAALEAVTAASSNEDVLRVTSQTGALAGSYSFRVNGLAAAQQDASEGFADASELVGVGRATVSGGFASLGATIGGESLNAGTYRLEVLDFDVDADEVTVVFDGINQTVAASGGSAFTVTAADGGTLTVRGGGGSEGIEGPGGIFIGNAASSLGELRTGSASITVIETTSDTTVADFARQLNDGNGPVRAQLIDTGDGSSTPTRLVVTSRQTGEDHAAAVDFGELSLFSGGLQTIRAAADATISLGEDGLVVTRSTNSIGDLFEGLSIDLVGTSPDTDVEIVVGADNASRVAAVSENIDAVSDILRKIDGYASYDVDNERGGPLVGDYTARAVADELQRAMGTVLESGAFQLLGQMGVSFQRDGSYAIDEDALSAALAEDPEAVERLLIGDPEVDDDGVFDVVAGAVDRLLEAGGRIDTAQQSAESSIEELDRAIANQEVRLEQVESRLSRQFAALETMIGQMQSQSSYLSSALGGGGSVGGFGGAS